ncbi:MAG: hypothetical protein OHK0017_13080 [Patescibacteria group bacterium]
MQSDKKYYFAIFGILVISLVGVGALANTFAKKEPEKKPVDVAAGLNQLNNSTRDNDKTPEIPAVSSLENIVGTYSGSGTLLATVLYFPKESLVVNNDGSFKFSASGFDTSLFNKEEIKINGEFPKVGVEIQGKILAGEPFKLQATSIQPNFSTSNNSKVDEATTQSILSKIEESGFKIPTATEAQPVVIEAEIRANQTDIKILNLKSSKLVVNFSGKKSDK